MLAFQSKDFIVKFDTDSSYTCTFTESANMVVDLGPSISKEYHGPVEVVPGPEYQTLHTTNRILADEIVIDPIPNNYGLISWNGNELTVS